MKRTILIAGAADAFRRYGMAIEASGGIPAYCAAPSGCGASPHTVRTGRAERADGTAWADSRKQANGVEQADGMDRTGGAADAELSAKVRRLAAASHALLLPGGGDIAPWRYGQRNTASRDLEPDRDAWDMALILAFAAAGKPVLGICRGMQSVNVFFGGTLLQDIPGHTQIHGADRFHPIRTGSGPFAALEAETVNSAHHQAADRIGDGLRVGQWAPDGIVEAVYHASLPVWGVQWHPERLAGTGARLMALFLRA